MINNRFNVVYHLLGLVKLFNMEIEKERREYIVLDDNTKIIDVDGTEYTATTDLWANIGMFQSYTFIERSRKENLICNKMTVVSIDDYIIKLKVGKHLYHKIPNWEWLGLSYTPFDGYQLSASLEYDWFINININENIFLNEHIKKVDKYKSII